eukprot:GHVN01091213.1.p2 GENE.GHVN01091213.1~~GHVN01091213.1.p2  ORF type:complete len:113 (+),score=7.28 GHVN01091213.1:123-461(+)
MGRAVVLYARHPATAPHPHTWDGLLYLRHWVWGSSRGLVDQCPDDSSMGSAAQPVRTACGSNPVLLPGSQAGVSMLCLPTKHHNVMESVKDGPSFIVECASPIRCRCHQQHP